MKLKKLIAAVLAASTVASIGCVNVFADENDVIATVLDKSGEYVDVYESSIESGVYSLESVNGMSIEVGKADEPLVMPLAYATGLFISSSVPTSSVTASSREEPYEFLVQKSRGYYSYTLFSNPSNNKSIKFTAIPKNRMYGYTKLSVFCSETGVKLGELSLDNTPLFINVVDLDKSYHFYGYLNNKQATETAEGTLTVSSI